MLRLAVSTVRDRWALFVGAFLTVACGVALVQSSLQVLMATGEPKVPPGVTGARAEEIREGYVGAATLLGMTVLLAGFLAVFIVASTFAFTVAQRRADLALLRTLGAGRGHLLLLLLGEGVLLGLAGSAAGVLLGVPAAWTQTRLLTGLDMLPGSFAAPWSFRLVGVSFAVGAGVAVLGVAGASVRAMRVRPMEALRGTGGAERVMTAGRWCAGLGLGGCAVALAASARPGDLLGALLIALGVSVLGAVAVSRLSPLLVPLAGRALGLAMRAATLGDLAQANLRDGVRRSASTAAPLIALVALAVGLAGMLGSQARATGTDLVRLTAGDLVVASTGADAARIAAVPGVADASTRLTVDMAVRVEQRGPAGTRRATYHAGIVAVDGPAYRRTHRVAPRSGSLDLLRGRTIAVGAGLAAEGVRVRRPATAVIGGRTVRLRVVAAMPERLENGAERFLVPLSLVPAGLAARAPAETVVRVAPGARAADVAARLRPLGTVRTVRGWADARVAAQARGNNAIMAVLLGLSGGYAALAVVNAMLIAGAERRAEFAVARLTGLARRQVVAAALAEAAAVTAIGLLLGGAVAAVALAPLATVPGTLAVPWTLIGLLAAGAFAVTAATSVASTLAATREPPIRAAAAR
ncbi:FtsX-like permease family protein [Actinomadura parmotrematis]|uniref:FtsX-like permease family protein n=1 Tax=Actinomadura parmotrematis TaxID=2864039 RepID=A0ABS7FRT3_9ACTN|nr:FtsX-like permease family protein [Actinomadura parmotrematis]MBW8483119.1 FtsX-like permease family protein [Actinomadura parmotrematis]